ncbi:MAG: hypothetical protein EOM80_13860 [Erysipelotrichia bacterium]|nr:hypothetical protein [Erysipelotrichia bacterium]
MILSRNGSALIYALILVVILAMIVSGQRIVTMDQSIAHGMTVFEAQARQGADSGLELCLRLNSAVPTPQLVNFTYPIDPLYPNNLVASMSIYYQLTGVATDSLASITAMVYDRNNTLRAIRRVERGVNRTARTFTLPPAGKPWVRR